MFAEKKFWSYYIDNSNCIAFRNGSLWRKKFLKRIVVCGLQKYFLQWYLFAEKIHVGKFGRRKKFLKRKVVCGLWKHFLQWYLFAKKILVEKFLRRKKGFEKIGICGLWKLFLQWYSIAEQIIICSLRKHFYSSNYLQENFMLEGWCSKMSFWSKYFFREKI